MCFQLSGFFFLLLLLLRFTIGSETTNHDDLFSEKPYRDWKNNCDFDLNNTPARCFYSTLLHSYLSKQSREVTFSFFFFFFKHASASICLSFRTCSGSSSARVRTRLRWRCFGVDYRQWRFCCRECYYQISFNSETLAEMWRMIRDVQYILQSDWSEGVD